MIAVLLHTFYATGIAFVGASLMGALTPVIAAVSLVVGWWMGRRHARWIADHAPGLKLTEFTKGEAGALEALLYIVIFYSAARHFAWLLFRHDQKLLTLSLNNFGDLPLHVNYIRAIASGMSFPIPNPSFGSEPLRYPFGPDLYNALWDTLGVPLQTHFFLVGIFATACTLMVLRWFGGWWAMGAFFLNGGIYAFAGRLRDVEVLPKIEWKNFLLTVFITQRGVLFALPAGLILIEMWRKHVSGESPLGRRALFALGLVWGLLPLFHAHAFFIVSIILLGVSLIELGFRKGFLSLFESRAFRVAVLPAFYFVWRTTDGFKRGSISHLDPWWVWPNQDGEILRPIWQNFGPWLLLPIAIALAIKFYAGDRKKMALRFAFAAGLFALFFNWMLAPWSWDNVKLLMWPYLMLAQLANETIDVRLPKFSRYLVASVLFASGFVMIAMSLGTPSQKGLVIYNERDLNAAAGALSAVPSPDAVFIAAPTHEHPLTYFGRLRVLGYEGHLWSHGIDSSAVNARVESIMRGESDWIQSMRAIGAEYIYWGLPEKTKWGETPRPWMKELANVSRVPEIAIYHLPSVGGTGR